MHSISVIISNFNGAKYLPYLIETLRAQEGVEVEVIVVDRNSTDESDAILAKHPEINVIKHPPETGLVCGYSAGLPAASHDLIFFCNEDMWFDPQCLRECAHVLLSSGKIAAVMPIQWSYDGATIVNAGIWYQCCVWNRADPVLTRDHRWHLVDRPARVSYVNAGACLARRAAFDQVGGWDSTFFLDYEDLDLGIRLWQRGWECWVAPAVAVGHAVGASNRKLLPNTGTTVRDKRYVHAFSNFLMIGLKYFSLHSLFRPFAAFSGIAFRNVLTGRFGNVLLDIRVMILTVRRIAQWVPFRIANRRFNNAMPGERFFFEPAFQYEAIRANKSDRKRVEVDPPLV